MELADIFRQHWDEYKKVRHPSAAEHKIAHAIMNCRTAALGGHLLECGSCGKKEIANNSCRNKHCPKCQGPKAAAWVHAREQELLPVGYFHSVFTIPAELNALVQMAPREMYEILFQAVSKTLLEIGKNNLQCEIAAICILHTWGSALTLHPDLHCLIPACGVNAEGEAVRFKKKRYFVADRILSAVFRGKFIGLLKKAYRNNHFPFHFDDIDAFLDTLTTKDWVVKTQPPFRGLKTVLKYLARYTHRVAIANNRILSADADAVTFHYKDYRNNGTLRSMKINPLEFIRRFFLHTLPKQFFRIRHYGFLSNTKKRSALALLRETLGNIVKKTLFNAHRLCCSHCGKDTLVRILEIIPQKLPLQRCLSP